MSDFYDELTSLDGNAYARENPTLAPLENVELKSPGVGLTLEDLEQMHAGELDPEELLSEDVLDEDVLDEDALDELELNSLKPSVKKSVKVSLVNAEVPESLSRESLVEELQQAFQWQEDQRKYALNRLDDTRRVLKQTQQLFQRLPQYVERLSQVLHAQEQCLILYDRLADLSENRGAAATIIQTARQIEVLEKNLLEKSFKGDELTQMQTDLERHQRLTARYQQIFDLAVALEKQGFSATEVA